MVQRSIRDLRELSYLLHPPMLDEAGLETALRARLASILNVRGLPLRSNCQGWIGCQLTSS